MKLNSIYLFATVLHLFFALPTEALIILGGDEGHTNAPPDDPGWDNIGYVRSMWNSSRASGVYIGDGWVLCSFHEIYYDGPTGIVFNAEPDKAYPIDVTSYVRLDTNNFTRLTDADNWTTPQQVYQDYSTNYERGTNWNSLSSQFFPAGADLAMFRLTENPDIEPVHITEISTSLISLYLGLFDNEVTAIATGRPRLEELTYWTTNWEETNATSTAVAYRGYKDWPNEPDPWYQPICRWGKNKLYASPTTVTRPPFGSTICLPTVFNDYGNNGGTDDTFQMARLDSGGGVFYKGTGQWELLGMLTAKLLPDESGYTVDTTLHPFGSYSLICDLSRYRKQIMKVTEWPDLSMKLSTDAGTWLEFGQQTEISIITTNREPGTVASAFTNTLQVVKNGQTNEIYFAIPSLVGGTSVTHIYTFTNDVPGTWSITATADSEDQIFETYVQNNTATKTFYAGPDLSIANSSPAITNTSAGTEVSFQITSKNQGNADTPDSFGISLYIHTNDVFTTLSELELADLMVDSLTVTGLVHDASITNSLAALAPDETGTYYLRARIDSSNQVDEAVESNNWGMRCEIRVGPDLVIAGSTPATTNAAADSSVSINVTVENQGAADVTNTFALGLYAINTQTDEGTNAPVQMVEIEGLSAKTSTTVTVTFTAPTTIGAYYLVSDADDYDSKAGETGAVDEAREDNNESNPYSRQTYTILYVGSDLTTSLAEAGPLYAAEGESVQLGVISKNTGGDPATGITNVLQLSTSSGFSPISNAWTNTITSLSAYSEQTNAISFQVPIVPGTYYLRARTDLPNVIKEFNENNNTSGTLTLYVGPDLIVSFTETNSVRTMAGTSISVEADVFNIGAGPATGVQNILQISTNDTFESAFNVSTNSGVGSLQFSLRAPREPGTYYLRAQTDTLNQTAEFDENNNISDILLLEVRPMAMPWLNLLLD